jgi:SAM-dependent methyltransferase
LNICTDRDRTETFACLVLGAIEDAGGARRVLDVGCGAGLSADGDPTAAALAAIRRGAGELWGCEPDPTIVPHTLLDHFVVGSLEDADLPLGYFDVIYAHYVVEHVTDPPAFLKKAATLLRPGGILLFMTPNARHYFVKVARVIAALNLESPILRLIHRRAAEVHYPTRYLMNDMRTLEVQAEGAGFSRADAAYFEHGDLRDYFPGVLKSIPIALEHVVQAIGEESLPGMVVRLRH